MDEIRGTFFKELRSASENFKKGVESGTEKQYNASEAKAVIMSLIPLL